MDLEQTGVKARKLEHRLKLEGKEADDGIGVRRE